MGKRQIVLFDLDQTLVDSREALPLRRKQRWQAVYQMVPELPLYEGIRDLWSQLRLAGCTIGVVTSSPRSYCQRILNYRDLSPEVNVCFHDTSRHKPHPAPLLEALRRANSNSQESLYVGDSPDDIRAAQSADILDVGALWGSESPERVSNMATHAFTTPANLTEWCFKHAIPK